MGDDSKEQLQRMFDVTFADTHLIRDVADLIFLISGARGGSELTQEGSNDTKEVEKLTFLLFWYLCDGARPSCCPRINWGPVFSPSGLLSDRFRGTG
ncbi:hypothetical protein TNIN_119031 [Trichonephila inaurata madagascariensis]|uniref:Uncharacterized protein n=1 Tax=Trichonephila inaurata madagascariensis TaxID=2747483 RepID=A0A8X6YRJ4_9ARAC|nr:hypothetical protein TNIN_119031 [Trichonephila inaurata madagascariensis]